MEQLAEPEGPVFQPLTLQTKIEAWGGKGLDQGGTSSMAELTVWLGLLAPRPLLPLITFSV